MAPTERRTQLLDAALAVIVRQGYGRVSVEAVAREAGVTRPVIYDHFAGLGQLLNALIEREERRSLDQLEHVLPEHPEQLHPIDVLSRSVRRFLNAVVSRPATWTLILLPLGGTPDIVRERVEANRARMVDRMETVVRWAMQHDHHVGSDTAGAPESEPDSIDVELAARAILGLAEDAGRMVLTDPQSYGPERYEQFVRALARLLGPR